MKLLMLSLPLKWVDNTVFVLKGVIDPNIGLVFGKAGYDVFVFGSGDFISWVRFFAGLYIEIGSIRASAC